MFRYIKPFTFILALLVWTTSAFAWLPVRLSVKFILSSDGMRSATGNLNTNAELDRQIEFGNSIFSKVISELRLEVIEVVDITGVSQYYTGMDIYNLRIDAINNQSLYSWRNDAVNVYINGGSGSGLAFGPYHNYNIVMIGQNCRRGTVIHEVGHSLALTHTHLSDSCSDTIMDNAAWNRDSISTNNFGLAYDSLTTSQKDSVDNVWFNIMSYHPTRNRITLCQMDRQSVQGYSDRDWIYSKIPIYVDSSYAFSGSGSFTSPYKDFQDALNSNVTAKVIVLEGGSYSMTQTQINDNVELVSRNGQSSIVHPDNSLYTLPTDLEHSQNPTVRENINAAALDDRLARRGMTKGKKTAADLPAGKAATAKIEADLQERRYFDKAVGRLIKAQEAATGKENIAILMELAQRYSSIGKCELARKYYKLVARNTKQKYLKDEALRLARECQ